jgi:hypothetical protein
MSNNPAASIYEPPIIPEDSASSAGSSGPPFSITGVPDPSHYERPFLDSPEPLNQQQQQFSTRETENNVQTETPEQQDSMRIHVETEDASESDDEVPASIQFESMNPQTQTASIPHHARRVANAILGHARPMFGYETIETPRRQPLPPRRPEPVQGIGSWSHVKNLDDFLTRVSLLI